MRYLITLTFAINALLGCTADTQTPIEEPTIEELADTFDALGIDTDLGDRIDHEGTPLPESYNPLGGDNTALQPKVEIYIAGLRSDAQELLLDEVDGALTPVDFLASDEAWADERIKTSLGVDVDGDGIDEIVVAYLSSTDNSLELAMIDPGDQRRMHARIDAEPSAARTQDNVTWPMDIAAADLDADGAREILLTLGDTLYILSVDGEAVTELHREVFPGARQVYVGAGNLDGDQADEVVVTWDGDSIGSYVIYDDDLEALADEYLVLGPAATVYTEAWVEVGDIDGDRLDEIVFLARNGETGTWELVIMDDARAELQVAAPATLVPTFFNAIMVDPVNTANTYASTVAPRPVGFALLDYDGNRDLEIFVDGRILDVDGGEIAALAELPHASHTFFVSTAYTGTPLSQVTVGDVDGDLRDEVVYVHSTGLSAGLLWVAGFDPESASLRIESSQPVDFAPLGDSGFDLFVPNITLTTANVDDDSVVLRFDGHELLFTDPQVLAAIAAPPYQEGLQSADDATTTLGRSSAAGSGSSETLGFSVGFRVGVEASFLGIAEVSAETEIEAAFDWSTSQSVTTESSFARTTGPGDDMVVFTAVPFDVYHYTIMASPNPEAVGTSMSISLPREPQTRATSRTRYNEINGDNPDVDETVFNHVPGDVWSYPTAADADRMASNARDGWFLSSNGTIRPTTGAGAAMVGLSRTAGTETEVAMDFSTTISVDAKAGGVTGGASLGFHEAWSYTMSVEESVFAEGSVGTLPVDAPDGYAFGMMMYQHEANMIVVDYWVED